MSRSLGRAARRLLPLLALVDEDLSFRGARSAQAFDQAARMSDLAIFQVAAIRIERRDRDMADLAMARRLNGDLRRRIGNESHVISSP